MLSPRRAISKDNVLPSFWKFARKKNLSAGSVHPADFATQFFCGLLLIDNPGTGSGSVPSEIIELTGKHRVGGVPVNSVKLLMANRCGLARDSHRRRGAFKTTITIAIVAAS